MKATGAKRTSSQGGKQKSSAASRPLLPPICSFWTPEYSAVAETCKAAAQRHGHTFDGLVLPSAGSWEENCALKARAVCTMLERHEAFWFLDADMAIQRPLEWLETDLSFLLQRPENLQDHHASQRYAYHLHRYGMRLLTGLMFWRRTEATVSLAQRWRDLCERIPTEWDEQHLMTAWLASGRPAADFTQRHLGSAYLASQRLPRQQLRERKVLLVGSAPDAQRWLSKHLEAYVEHGYAVVALNNAWQLVSPEWLHGWIRPADFRGKEPPPEVYRLNGMNAERWLRKPLWDAATPTTLVHALYHLLNDALRVNVRLIVHIVGCDMDYDRKRTHFYGNGSPDPLRFDAAHLAASLSRLQGLSRVRGYVLANAGGHAPTRLPFMRVSGPEETRNMTEHFIPTIITLEDAQKPHWTADRDIYLTPHGSVVEADHPERRRLLVGRGAHLPMDKAIGLGVVKIAAPDPEPESLPEPRPERKKRASRPRRSAKK